MVGFYMATEAMLVDTQAIPRLLITRLSGPLVANHFIPSKVQVLGPQYQIHGKAALDPQEIEVPSLTELLSDFQRTTIFSVWGLPIYQVAGPLLTCKLTGDGVGHFTVDVEFAEDTRRFSDQFVTEQTCLRQFITDRRRLGD